ncbi:MAG: DUF1549 and DUF1553 domain-containing protein, partial [Verrucomicrobiales bacterium]|nr:DUF1549 and DUF1553 domain-containing protein [Verrucomicrobiales bacterium]
LDLARYADTIGYHSDNERDVTPYRDYVIDAFNTNKRYDVFTREQLAGDLLEKPTTGQLVATTFNRVNQISGEGGIQDAEYIAKYYSERVRTTSVAFLGSTMGCAECHDHKFDPFSTRDFYAMEAFFADIYEKGAYNGDGRYNEGADLKNYAHLNQDFSLTQWGPNMKVPSATQLAEIARLAKSRAARESDLQQTSPELETAFTAWVAALRPKTNGSEPVDVTILDDSELPLPADAKSTADKVHSGKLARVQQAAGLIQHIVSAEKNPVQLAAGDTLFAHVFLDPQNPPKQIMLQFHADDGSAWNHRAHWGGDHIPNGKGTNNAAHLHRGDLPPLGKWTRIEVPAADIGLPAGKKITQLAFTQFGGKVFWDLSGRHTSDPATTLADLPENARNALVESAGQELGEQQKQPLLAHFRTITPLLDGVRKEIAQIDEQTKQVRGSIRNTLVSLPATPREIRILPRGDWMDKTGEVVAPSFPSFLPQIANESGRRLNRLDLANWITAADNPLTARAFVNRLWNMFLGAGLSRDLQDLGNQGQWPTHPGLLDWLAVEFVESGWDIKHMVGLIVSSETYSQNSAGTRGLWSTDPYNKLFARQSPRRLKAEFIRDNALAISGLLNTEIGGTSVRPYQPAKYYANLNFPKRTYKPHNDKNQYRRGLYMHWQRTFLHPMLVAFDAPPREECTADRANSNTPLQALDLLNDPTFVEAARALAQNLLSEKSTFPERLTLAFTKTLSRPPSAGESKLLTTLYDNQLERYTNTPADAAELLKTGLHPVPENLAPAELAATTAVTRAILNLHETITRF